MQNKVEHNNLNLKCIENHITTLNTAIVKVTLIMRKHRLGPGIRHWQPLSKTSESEEPEDCADDLDFQATGTGSFFRNCDFNLPVNLKFNLKLIFKLVTWTNAFGVSLKRLVKTQKLK